MSFLKKLVFFCFLTFYLLGRQRLVKAEKNETQQFKYKPVVLWHGLGDTANGSIKSVIDLIKDELNHSIYVASIGIGPKTKDFYSTFFGKVEDQIDIACEQIKNDSNLKQGFNLIGFSQGGQFSRGLVEKCDLPQNGSVINLITLGAQHQGIYGLPKCFVEDFYLCKFIDIFLDFFAYNNLVQENLVQAQYWHDPLNTKLYKKKSIFLADINNEKNIKNEKYKNNLLKLKNFVMVKFLNDTVVDPVESEHFGFFEPGQTQKIQILEETELYKKDWLGLKVLKETNRLLKLNLIGDHVQFNKEWFTKEIIHKFLNISLN